MIQGNEETEQRNAEPFAFDPQQLDALVLSHAQIDHIGRVPLLVKRGFRGPIFAQAATADQAGLLDWYGRIGGRAPVYLVHDEDAAPEALAGRLRERYGCRIELSRPGVTVSL
ncbi:MBL fold metallo-hydrolase [Tahibacter caeni]|uniref:MBL fold metallo-hydrolase n=1 Tax=Tahibacter caeni TaxID=1453545 RepID=UPI002147A4E9|nr:MBL fold metallo-hydrolase [Tahibacter caeni]